MKDLVILAGREWTESEWVGQTTRLFTRWNVCPVGDYQVDLEAVAISGVGQGGRAQARISFGVEHRESLNAPEFAQSESPGNSVAPLDGTVGLSHPGRAMAVYRLSAGQARLYVELANLDPSMADVVFALFRVTGRPRAGGSKAGSFSGS